MRFATVAFVVTLAAGLAVAAGVAAAEDRLVLKDGQVVAGRIVTESDSEVQIVSNEKTMRVPRTTIERVEREGALVASSSPAPQQSRAARPGADAAAHASAARAPHEATPEFLKWIDLCVQNLASGDPGVRQGATVALRAAGATAKPALDKAAASDNAKLSQAATSVLAQIAVQGQPGADARQKRNAHSHPGAGSSIVKQLGLSSEQQPKVEEILDQHDHAMASVSKDAREGKLPKDQAKAKINATRTETETKLSKVLTAEQLKKYKELSVPPAAEPAANKTR